MLAGIFSLGSLQMDKLAGKRTNEVRHKKNSMTSVTVREDDTWTHTLPEFPKYNRLYACVHIQNTHLHWLQMQYIVLLVSKTLITLCMLISHKYSEGKAIIKAYIYPTWLKESSIQCSPQGWASPTQLWVVSGVELGQQTHRDHVLAQR